MAINETNPSSGTATGTTSGPIGSAATGVGGDSTPSTQSGRAVERRPAPASKDALRAHSQATDEFRATKEGATQRISDEHPAESWADVIERTHTSASGGRLGRRMNTAYAKQLVARAGSRNLLAALLAIGAGVILLAKYRRRLR